MDQDFINRVNARVLRQRQKAQRYANAQGGSQQPQDDSSALVRGFTSGAAGVLEGQAQLGNLMGVGDGEFANYLQGVGQRNARKKEYTIGDMLPFSSDYWTNTEGAAYDVANLLGSSGTMMAETAALATGAGALAGALGAGGAAAASGGVLGAAARGAALAPQTVQRIASGLGKAAKARGLNKLGSALEGPFGQLYALNILKTPIEVSSEAGTAGADALAEGADIDEARKRAAVVAAIQMPLLALSNTLEASNLGGIFAKEAGEKVSKDAFREILKNITQEGLQNAWEEGMQQSSQEYAADKQSLLGVVNPLSWSEEARQQAAVGGVGGLVLGGGNAALRSFGGRKQEQQETEQETAGTEETTAPQAETTETDKAREYLDGLYDDADEEGKQAIGNAIDSDDDNVVLETARRFGWNKQSQEQPAGAGKQSGTSEQTATPAAPTAVQEQRQQAVDAVNETIDQMNNGNNATQEPATAENEVIGSQGESSKASAAPKVKAPKTQVTATDVQTGGTAKSWLEAIKSNIPKQLRKIKKTKKFLDAKGEVNTDVLRQSVSLKRFLEETPDAMVIGREAVAGDKKAMAQFEKYSYTRQAAVLDALKNGLDNWRMTDADRAKAAEYDVKQRQKAVDVLRQRVVAAIEKEGLSSADKAKVMQTPKASSEEQLRRTAVRLGVNIPEQLNTPVPSSAPALAQSAKAQPTVNNVKDEKTDINQDKFDVLNNSVTAIRQAVESGKMSKEEAIAAIANLVDKEQGNNEVKPATPAPAARSAVANTVAGIPKAEQFEPKQKSAPAGKQTVTAKIHIGNADVDAVMSKDGKEITLNPPKGTTYTKQEFDDIKQAGFVHSAGQGWRTANNKAAQGFLKKYASQKKGETNDETGKNRQRPRSEHDKQDKGRVPEPVESRTAESRQADKNQNGAAERVANKKAVSVEENIANGKKAIEKVIETHEDVENAMYREDVGDIDFVWGEEGTADKSYENGFGLAKIVKKHGVEDANKIPQVIATGKVVKRSANRMFIDSEDMRVVIRFDWNGEKRNWLLTGYTKDEKKQPAPTSEDRRDVDTASGTSSAAGSVASSTDSIPQKAKEGKTKPESKIKPDKNGFTPISNGKGKMYFEGDELGKIQEANTKAVLKAAQEFVNMYDDGKFSAEEARSKITALYDHYYSKAKVKPYTDDLRGQISSIRKSITAKEAEKVKLAKEQERQEKQRKEEEAKAQERGLDGVATEAAKTIEGDPLELDGLSEETRKALDKALTDDEKADLENAATDKELDKDADAGRKLFEEAVCSDFAVAGQLDDDFNARMKKLEKYYADEEMPFESTKAALEKYAKLLIKALAKADKAYAKANGGENKTRYSAAATGIPSTPLSRTLYQAAYHGSPHIFDEFSLEHIGEGEGTQAHGWGLYFAKEEATAQGYRDTLSVGLTGEISFIDPETGKEIKYNTANASSSLWDMPIGRIAHNIIRNVQKCDNDIQKAIKMYQRRINNLEANIIDLKSRKDTSEELKINRWQKLLEDSKKAVVALQNAKSELVEENGAIFEVDIPENDVLLDEQKPYNEQPDKIKAALLKMSKEVNGFGLLGKAIKYNDDGRDLYRAIGKDAFYNEYHYEGGSSESAIEASKALNKYGIKGITYDGWSDGRCFVIFDDAAIEIKRRYDEAIANNQSEMQRSYDEVFADAKAAFPKGKFELLDSGDYLVTMPNGAKIRISIKNRIVVNAKEKAGARASHGLNKDSDIVIQGSWTKLHSSMLDGVLRVSQESKGTTAFHEAFHAVWDLALNEREKQALLKYYTSRAEKQGRDVHEVMADAYADWTVARQQGRGTVFGKLWQKLKDFAERLWTMFVDMDNVHDIMRRIETNEVWTRKVNKDNSSSGPRYSAVGEHGNITDKAKLELAKTMESAGKSPEEIFDATGWWKGADSRWRFEIKDNLKAIDLSKLKSAAVRLQNIYTNDTLYEHYPELKNVPVRLADLGGAYGKTISGEIRIDKKLLKTSPDRAKETLLHEMQHVIQRIEGFARGGDPTTAIDRVYGLLRELKTNKLPTLYDRIHPSYGFWKSRLRAIEAREKNGNPKKTDTTQKPKLIAKIKEAEDTYEKKHGSKDIERINQYESNLEQAQWQIDEYDGLVKEMQEDGWDKYMAASIIDETAGGTFYQALLGEQEARATAQRATGKASKYPWQDLTHSYKNKSLIVYGDEASSTRVKKKADPDIITLNKKYKDKLVQAYAKGANNSEITAIMNAHQGKLIKLFEQKKLEQKEKARVRATELRNLRKAFKNGEIDEYTVGGVTIKRGEDGQEVVDDVSENLTKRTYVNQRHAGKKYKNATEEIQDIVHRTERRGYIQKIRDWLKEQKDHFYRNWVDKNTDLNIFDKAYAAAAGKILDSADTILAKAQYITNNANGAAFALIEGDLSHIKIAQQKYGFKHLVSFKMILDELVAKKGNYKEYMKKYYASSADKGVQGYIDAFDNYIVARGLLEASQNHKLDYDREVADWTKNGSKGTQPVFKEYKLPGELTEEKLKEIIDDAPKEFNGLAKKYYQFNDNLLDIMEHSGLITKEQHAVLNGRYQSYCPLMRDFTDTAAVDNFVGQLSSGKGIGNVSDPMKRRRSEGSARDIVSPLESTIKATANIIIKCERNKVGQTLVNRAKEAGLTDLVEQVEGTTGDAKNCIFTVWENGEKHAYRTTQELYPAVTQSFEPGLKLTWALMTKPAEILRAGSTSSPSFIIRNFLRDTIWAGISSKNGFIPIVDSLRGAWALRHNKQLRAEFETSGVISSAFYNDAEAVRRSLDDMVGGKYETHGLLDILKALGKYPIDFLKFFGDNVEASTRMGEFMRARENGKSIEQAAVDAIEVTLNFNRSGVEGQQANRVIPFFNACIQGGDKLYRLMKEDPGGTMGRIGLYIMLPSLGLWLLNHDEDWYKELDPNIKATCWVLPGGIRIPKPQEAGILFGTGVEAMLDAAYEQDPKAVGNWVKTYLGDTMLPNFLPTVLLPIIEWQSNYSFFRGKPVVNATQQKLPDEMQYGPYTTEAAKIIGKTAAATPVGGISPVKIDNAWRSITGTMGMFLLQIPDLFAAEKQNLPEKKLTEMPIIRDFIVNEMNKNRTMNDFYALKDAADKQHRAYGKAGKPKKEVQSVSAAARLISQKRMEIRDIINSPRLNPMRKRELIDKKEQESKRIAQLCIKKYGKYFDY